MKISSNHSVTTRTHQAIQQITVDAGLMTAFLDALERTTKNSSNESVSNSNIQKIQNIEKQYTKKEIDEILYFFDIYQGKDEFWNKEAKNYFFEHMVSDSVSVGDYQKFMNTIKGTMKSLEEKGKTVYLSYWGITENQEYYYTISYWDSTKKIDELKNKDYRYLDVMIRTTKEPYASAFEVVDMDIKDFSPITDGHEYENFDPKETTEEKPTLKDEKKDKDIKKDTSTKQDTTILDDKPAEYIKLKQMNMKYNDFIFELITKFLIEHDKRNEDNTGFKEPYRKIVHLVEENKSFDNSTPRLSTQDIIKNKQQSYT